MAPFGKIYSYPGNFRVQRAQVLAELNGLEIAVADGFQMGVTNKTEDFLAKFPMGKVPAFEGADGFCLAEGAAIAAYAAASGPKAAQLLGDDVQTRARIAEWSCFAESELIGNALPVAGMVVFKVYPMDEAKLASSLKSLDRALQRVETGLKGGRTTLVGDKVTMADVMVGGVLAFAFKFLVGADMRKNIPDTVAFVEKLAAVPEFKKHFGELEMCEKTAGKA
ncbi:glutathione S-transferase [Xylariaceae sp. FL0016]|nr:glutathione S-transferase [Xylariaceae sp. FL0016]